MANLFYDLIRKYGNPDKDNTIDTGIKAQVSKEAMQAYCRMKNIPYKDKMEINYRLEIRTNKDYTLSYKLVKAGR